MAQSKLCQLCRMVFRSKEELDHHLRTKHVSQSAETSLYSSDEPSEKKVGLRGCQKKFLDTSYFLELSFEKRKQPISYLISQERIHLSLLESY